MKINSASQRGINESPDLPDMTTGVEMFFQNLTVGIVYKKQNNEGYLQEFVKEVQTQGVIQTMSPAQLAMKPEGQRTWQWRKLHMLPKPRLILDGIVVIRKVRYRVMDVEDNSQYGVVSYDIQEDYSNEK